MNYSPLRNYSPDSSVITQLNASYKSSLSEITFKSKEVKKEVESAFTGLGDYINEIYREQHLMYKDTLSKYVQSITNKIISKNQSYFNGEYKIFIYRTPVANASSFGQNVVLVNLELILKLNNEEELAFIICHELAHDIKNHIVNSIITTSELLLDKDLQKEIKNAKSQQYNSSTKMEELYYKYLSRSTEHSRKNELEADSVGFKLFINAGYNALTSLKTMQRLDSIDLPLFKELLPVKEIFNFKNLPFKPVWLEFDADAPWVSSLDSLYELPDSLKTHPDCLIRKNRLEKMLFAYSPKPTSAADIKIYSAYQEIALFEKIEFLINENSFGEALYYCLQMQKIYPKNDYLKISASYCLYGIYSALIDHTFSTVVDFPDKEYPKAYNEYLKFIHNISSSSLKDITKNYFVDNVMELSKCEYTGFTYLLIKSLDKEPKDRPELCKEFESVYKNTYYCKQLNAKLNPPPQIDSETKNPKNKKQKK